MEAWKVRYEEWRVVTIFEIFNQLMEEIKARLEG